MESDHALIHIQVGQGKAEETYDPLSNNRNSRKGITIGQRRNQKKEMVKQRKNEERQVQIGIVMTWWEFFFVLID